MGLYDAWNPEKAGFKSDLSLDENTFKSIIDAPAVAPPQPETGYLKGTAQTLGRGIVGIGEQAGQAMEWNADYQNTIQPGQQTGDESKLSLMNKAGHGLKIASEKLKDSIGEPTANSFAKKAWFGGVESLPVSLAYAVPSYIGAIGGGALGVVDSGGALSVPQAIAGAAIMQAPTSAVMYRAAAQETADNLRKINPTIDNQKLMDAAVKAGHAEWMGEAISDIPEAVIFSRLPGFKGVIKSVREGIKPTAKGIAKNMLATQASEQLGENYTTYQQTKAMNDALPADKQQNMGQNLLDAVGSTAVMSLLMGGAGTGAQYYQGHKIEKALENPAANPEKRGEAAGKVFGMLKDAEHKKLMPEGSADNFLRHAMDAIGSEETTGSAPYALDLTDTKLLQPFAAPQSSETVSGINQQVSAMPGQQADTSTGTAGASPATGGADAMGNIPEFGSPAVARDGAVPPIAGGNQYQQFADAPFTNAPAQPAIAGPAVEGMLGNLKPIAADGSKNSLASALLAGANPYQQFAEQPFTNAPAQPAIAGPAVEGMLGSVQPAPSSPRFQALQWAQQQMQDPATSKFERQNLNALMKAADPEKRDLVKYWASFTGQRKQPAAIAGVKSQQGAISSNDAQPGKTTQVTAAPTSIKTVSPAPKRDRSIQPATDDMITAIGKLGGLNLDQVKSQWGSTVTDSKADLNRHASKEGKSGILHVISSKGKSLDAMREALEEHGYLPQGSSIEDMYARIDQHLTGKPTYSNQNQQQVEDQDLSQAPDGVEESDYPFDLEGINFPEKDKKHLKFLKRMLAKARDAKTRSKIEQAIVRLNENTKQAQALNTKPTADMYQLSDTQSSVIETGNAPSADFQVQGEQLDRLDPKSLTAQGNDYQLPQKTAQNDHEQQYLDAVSKRFEEKFKSAIFKVDEEEQKRLVQEGRYAIDRIPENIERSTLQGTIGAAARIAAGSHQADAGNDVTATADKRARGELESLLKSQEKKALIAWAKQHDLLIDPAEFTKQWDAQGNIAGAEHHVYITKDQRVIKRSLSPNATWLQYMQRLAMHNYLFEDVPYTLKGFMVDKGQLFAVVEQPFVESDKTNPATTEEVAKLVNSKGYATRKNKEMVTLGILDSKYDEYLNDQGVLIDDLHEKNAFRAYDGTIAVIDAIIKMDPDTKRERLMQRYGLQEQKPAQGHLKYAYNSLPDPKTPYFKQLYQALKDKLQTGEFFYTNQLMQATKELISKDIAKTDPQELDITGIEWGKPRNDAMQKFKDEIQSSPRGTWGIVTEQRDNGDVLYHTYMSNGSEKGPLASSDVYRKSDEGKPSFEKVLARTHEGEIANMRKIVEDDLETAKDQQAAEVSKLKVGDSFRDLKLPGEKPFSTATITAIKDGKATLLVTRRGTKNKWEWSTSIRNLESVLDQNGKLPQQTAVSTESLSDTFGVQPEQETEAPTADQGPVPMLLGEKIGGARKDLESSGAPSKPKKPASNVPAWKRRYLVSEVANRDSKHFGKWLILDTTTSRPLVRKYFDSAKEAEQFLPLAVFAVKHRVQLDGDGTWKIVRNVTDRKRVTLKDGFESEEAANRYVVEHTTELIEQNTYFGEEIIARPETVRREGPQHRDGNATATMFMDTFGFRSAEFGNWNNEAERQEILNHAFDSLMDMADLLNIPPKAVSLNGELAIAFGARGQGLSGAAAHYEPGYAVINLTKMAGAGHLFHEWLHAMDNYFARQDGRAKSEKELNKRGDLVYPAKKEDMVSDGFSRKGSGVRQEVQDAFLNLMETIWYKTEQYVEDADKAQRFVQSALDNVNNQLADIRRNIATERRYGAKKKPATAEQLQRFDALAAKLQDPAGDPVEWRYGIGIDPNQPVKRGNMGQNRWTNDALEELSALVKEVTGRSGFNAEGHGEINYLASRVRDLHNRNSMLQEAKNRDTKTKKLPTSFRQEAYKIDQGRSSDYWTDKWEMLARAGSAYMEDKLQSLDRRNDFLSFGSDNKYYRLFNIRPFPEGQERESINKAFDSLFNTLKTKETDKGISLYAKTENTSSPEEQQQIQQAITGKSATEVLQYLIDKAPTLAYKMIATRAMKAIKAAGMPVNFTIAHVGDSVPAELINRKGNTDLYQSGKIEIRVNGIDTGEKSGMNMNILLHEFVHAATMGAINNPTPATKQAIEGIASVGQKIRTTIQKKLDTGEQLNDVESRIYARDINALDDTDEVLTWGLTIPEFQNYLETIPHTSGTLWSRFVSAVRSLLGLHPKADTALSTILKAADTILDNPMIYGSRKGSMGRHLIMKTQHHSDIVKSTGMVDKANPKPFYSAVSKLVSDAKQTRWGSVQDLLNWMKGKVTQDEINQLGLADLEGKPTKQEVLDQIAANSVEFKDVVLGDYKQGWGVFDINGNLEYQYETQQEAESALKDLIARGHDDINSVAPVTIGTKPKNPTHFSQYTEPGAVEGSYREMFVTVPELKDQMLAPTHDNDLAIFKPAPSWNDGHSQYKQIQNPVVRIRFNDREVDGKRILFVEEMQGPSDANQQKMPDYLKKRIYDIGVKRILAYAKEQGYDGISWTTGDMQAKRYDLSKQVKTIYAASAVDRGNKTYDLDIFLHDGQEIRRTSLDANELSDNIGKELAQKVIENDGGKYTGLDLKVGGEGLKALYDRTLPALFKKYGKGQVGEISIASDRSLAFDPSSSDNPARDYMKAKEGEMTVPFIPITDTTPASYPQFSLTSPAGTGLKATELQQEFDGVPFKSRIKVVQTAEELPGFGSKSLFSKMVEGQYKNGTIYLVADNLPSVERARVVALGHELAHAGQSEKLTDLAAAWFRDALVKGANGSKFQQATLKILNQEAVKRGYKLTDPADFRKAVQEATAVIAETAYRTGDKAGLMTKLLMYIKHFLRNKLGIKLDYSDKELVATVIEMMRQGAKNLTNGNGPDGGQFAAAWHGSPHDHNGFSTEHIGTGEGAQAYGWGLYFAGAREVAEYYRKALSEQDVRIDGKRSFEWDINPDAKEILLRNDGDIDAALKSAEEFTKTGGASLRQAAKAAFKELQDLKNRDAVTINKGRLYKVELAPAEDEYLLWDKPLSEQSEKVKEAINGLPEKWQTVPKVQDGTMTGEQLYKGLASFREASEASADLHSLGIRGIKYLDGNSRNRPMKDIKKAFLSALPEDAEFSDVMDLVGTGKFSQEQEALLKALEADDWLGFDYPAQAISAALGNDLKGFDPSKKLSDAVAELAKDQQFNYVIFNDADVTIEEKYSLASPTDAARDRQLADHLQKQKFGEKTAVMVRSLFDLLESALPPKLKANMGKILNNPWWGSEGNPIRRAIVNLNLTRSHVRNALLFEVMKADGKEYQGIEGLEALLNKGNKQDKALWNKLIKQGDIDEKWYTDAELKAQGANKLVIQGYRLFHTIVDKINQVRFRELKDIALLPYKNESWFDDLKAIIDLREKLDQGLEPAQKAILTKLLRSLKDNPDLGKLAKKQPEVVAAYKEFIKQLKATSDPHLVRMAYRHINDYHTDIDKIRNEWGFVKGYAPRMRKDGDWHVSVYKVGEADGTETRTKVYMKPVNTELGATRLIEQIKRDMAGHLKSNYNKSEQYVFDYKRDTSEPGELLSDRASNLALESLVNSALEDSGIFKSKDVDVAAIKRAIKEELAHKIMAQGFSRHGIKREEYLIEGYRDDDYLAVLKEFGAGQSGWLSKIRYATEVTREADGIAQANPDDKVWVHNYYKDSMRNSTYLDEIAATARSVGAVYYLGFKFSSALLNGFQNYTVGQAELSSMMKKAGKKGEPVLILTKAMGDVLRSNLSDEEKLVLDKAIREGTLHAQAVRAMSGLQEQGFGGKWKKFAETAMTPFSWVEQHVNREPAMLAAYRVFRDKATPAGQIDAAAFAKAEEFVNNTQFLMGNENLPELVRMLGPVGKTAYLFQGYVHNYLLWLAKRGRGGEFEAIARSFGAIALLGGAFALPGGDDLDKWIEKWFGVSYKLKAKQWINRQTKEYGWAGYKLEGFINHGLPAVFGVDMSRAIAVNLPFMSDTEKSFGERIGGVWSGLAKKPGMAASALQSGDYLRAVENLVPEFVANPMRAARQYSQGATTLAGKPIFDENGRQMKYGIDDAAKKALGFNPLEVSEQTELRGHARSLKAHWTDKRDDALAQIRKADNGTQIREIMQTFNRDLKKSQAYGPVGLITLESVHRARNVKPNKKQLQWQQANG